MSDIPLRAVTTCNKQGYTQYGHRMLLSFLQHWPISITLWEESFDCRLPGVFRRDIESIRWLGAFIHANPPRRGRYNYRFDAAKFAHKAAVVITESLAAAQAGERFLMWIDADTFTHADVPREFIEQQLLPRDGEYISWLERDGNYPECGLYVLNLQHPFHVEQMREWQRLYTTGALFGLPEWHDSFVLQHLVQHFAVGTRSLSGHARGTSHPFINGPLGAFVDHMKGQRKRRGRSPLTDLRCDRIEPYWSGRK